MRPTPPRTHPRWSQGLRVAILAATWGRPIRLPIPETDGLHGLDPGIALDGANGYRIGAHAKAFDGRGADAYSPSPERTPTR